MLLHVQNVVAAGRPRDNDGNAKARRDDEQRQPKRNVKQKCALLR